MSTTHNRKIEMQNRTETFLARFNKPDKNKLRRLAKEKGCSMADILVEALRLYYKEEMGRRR